MSYSLHNVPFRTIQGEGGRAGTSAVFVRFAGCNAWNGRPEDRDKGKGACARWCDTSFFRGSPFTLEGLLSVMDEAWPLHRSEESDGVSPRWCVLTGGEPMLQIDHELLSALHAAHWKVAVETNGSCQPSINVLRAINWLCVSPKRRMPLDGTTLGYAHELKVVLPGVEPGDLPMGTRGWAHEELRRMGAMAGALREGGAPAMLFVQPQDVPDASTVEVSHLTRKFKGEQDEMPGHMYASYLRRCVDFVHGNSDWRVSLQSHKYAGLR